jgi:hypothetical protein
VAREEQSQKSRLNQQNFSQECTDWYYAANPAETRLNTTPKRTSTDRAEISKKYQADGDPVLLSFVAIVGKILDIDAL